MRRFVSGIGALIAAFTLALGSFAAPASADGRTLFVTSAVENGDGTATLPLHRGTSTVNGQVVTIYYVVLDTSSGSLSDTLGVNRSQKLANARGSQAVQKVTYNADRTLKFPGTVDFAPDRVVVPGPSGFPPAVAQPGSIGDAAYSPLAELPDGTIVNAPHVANDFQDQMHDKVKAIDKAGMRVRLEETDGFQGGRPVKYISTDASFDVAAALEGATYAPRLNKAPFVGDDSTASSRTSLAAFVNGQTGASNPQRQGLNSALLDGLSPLNVLRWNPTQGRYSPLWDVHPAAWTATAVATGQNLRQTDWGDIQGLVDHGLITGPGGAPFGPGNFIVNCPIVSRS